MLAFEHPTGQLEITPGNVSQFVLSLLNELTRNVQGMDGVFNVIYIAIFLCLETVCSWECQ